MKTIKDKVVVDVRRVREEVWKEYQRDPVAFNEEAEKIRKKLHLRRSKLKPIAASLQEIKERKFFKKSA